MSGTQAAEHEVVKERRRAIIHTIIAEAPASKWRNGAGAAYIQEECESRGDWPEAHWDKARKGPPDAQQVNNYLKQLVHAQKVERVSHGVYRALVAPEPLDRLMRKGAPEALQLQSEGLSGTEIAERLEISKSLAYGLLNDPYGEKERERKRMYCPVCGAKKDGSVDWCRKCKTGKVENLLPPKDFMRFAHRAEREQGVQVLFGVTPDCERVIRIGTARGVIEYKLKAHESWDDAVEAAGLS